MPRMLVVVLKAVLAFYLIIGLSLWLVSPWVSNYFIAPILAEKKIKLSDSATISYNPFISQISVSDLALLSSESPTAPAFLSLKRATVELNLWRLIDKTLRVSQFDVDGLKLQIKQSKQGLVVAGWPMNTTKQGETITEQPETNKEAVQAYQLALPNLSLTNSSVTIDWYKTQHHIDISEVSLTKLSASNESQSGQLSFALKVDNAPINFTADFSLNDVQGEINYQLALKDLQLANVAHFVTFPRTIEQSNVPKLLQATLSLNYQHKIKITDYDIVTTVEDVDLSLTDSIIHINNVSTSTANKELTSKNININLVQWQELSPQIVVNGETNLKLNQLNTFTTEKHSSLANIKSIAANAIQIKTVNGVIQLKIPQLFIEQASFSDHTQDQLPPLAQFSSLAVNNINISELGLSTGDIVFSGIATDIKIQKDKSIAGLINLEQSLNSKKIAKTEDKPSPNVSKKNTIAIQQTSSKSKQVFPIAIKAIKIADPAFIKFIDESITPAYKQTFELAELATTSVDNQIPNQISTLTAKGKSNKYAHFTFAVNAKVFATKPYYKLDGTFNEVDLTSISSYLKKPLGYEFNSGHLDLTLDVEVNDNKLDGNAHVLLSGVELGAANNPHAKAITESTSIPFNYTINLLKDSDGNVDLDIPLKGNTSAPDFSLSGLAILMIKQATMAAAKEYLLLTFVPYANIVKIGLSASDYLLKVRLNDLPLQPTQIELPTASSKFIEEFSTLMKKKKDLDFKLCAFAIPADIGISDNIEALTDEQIHQLNQLSIARMHAFKDLMVEEHKIKSSRLLLCSPKVDKDKGALPRLTFTD